MTADARPDRTEYPSTRILRNNPGMVRDCYWDGDFFVIRQISAAPNGIDELRIKAFRFDPEETVILLDELSEGPAKPRTDI